MTTDTVGGVWQFALELSRGLGQLGIEVTLASMGREPSLTQRREAASIPSLTLESSRFKLEWMPDPWEDVEASGRWLLELDRSVRPDVVHLNGYCHASLTWTVPALIVAHSCALSWWDAVRRVPIPDEWHRYAVEVRRGLRAAARVYAPSRAMASSIDRWYGISARVIPNGCGSSVRFEPAATKQRIVFGAGRLWDEAKNLAALDEAGIELPCPIFLAGDTAGPWGQEFEPKSATALGTLSRGELATWMRHAAIYALPARYEPFGLSVLEAALCGCALVLGDIPSLRENWDGAALFVDPEDVGALRQILRSLVASPELCHQLGKRARIRAGAFTAERMTAAYLTAYEHLLQPHDSSHMAATA